MKRTSLLVPPAAIALLVAAPTLAEAQPKLSDLSPEKRKRLGELLAEAKQLTEQGAFARSVQKLDEAYRIFPYPRILLRQAESHVHLGKLEEAHRFYARYLKDAPDAKDRDEVRGILANLDKRLNASNVSLSITTNPAGARVEIRGEGDPMMGATPLRMKLTRGHYRLRISKAGHQTLERTITLRAEQKATLNYALLPIKKEAPRPTPRAKRGTSAPLVLGGIAAVSGITAGVTQYYRYKLDQELDEARRDETRPSWFGEKTNNRNTLQIVSLVSGGVAVVALGSAIVIWSLDSTPAAEPPRAGLRAPGVWWSGDAAGVQIGGSF